LWSRDAVVFVRWLNSVVNAGGTSTRQTEGILFRLPTIEELTGLADQPGSTAQALRSRANRVWCLADGDVAPTVWTLPGLSRADVVAADELRDRATADLRRSTVLRVLLVRAAGRAVHRLSATGSPIRQASRALAEILEGARAGNRAGDRAGDLERNMMTALEIVRDLLGYLREAQRAATALDRALRNLDTMEADVASVR
jgi:hypothetical protein